MNIVTNISDTDESCSRCLDLGLPEGNIPAGQMYYMFRMGNRISNCCMDCFDRLQKEVVEQ